MTEGRSQSRARARAIHWRYDSACLITVAPMCRVAPISSPSTPIGAKPSSLMSLRSALRGAIGTPRLIHPFVIEAWVLLPDHMHALWTLPPGDEDFSYRWWVIKRMVTQRCQTRPNRPGRMNARRNGTKAPCRSIDSGNISPHA